MTITLKHNSQLRSVASSKKYINDEKFYTTSAPGAICILGLKTNTHALKSNASPRMRGEALLYKTNHLNK